MDKIGDFITESGSRDLPPIYNRYFKPRYFGNQRTWTFVGDRSNDIFSDIFSEMELYNHLKGGKKIEKIEEIVRKINSSNNSIKKEIKDVTTWFDAKTKAKDLLTQLTIILDKIYKELKPLIPPKLPAESTSQKLLEPSTKPELPAESTSQKLLEPSTKPELPAESTSQKLLEPSTKPELPAESTSQKLPVGVMQEIAKASIETNIKNAIDNPNVTQAAIFSETDNMFKAGGDSTRAILNLINTEGNKRKQKNYHYGNFKHDIIEDLIKKRLKNTNPSRDDKIKEARKLDAKVWLKLESVPEKKPLSSEEMAALIREIAIFNNETLDAIDKVTQKIIDHLRQEVKENLRLGANLNGGSTPPFFYITLIKNTNEQLEFTKFIIKNSKVPINISSKTGYEQNTILHLLGLKINLFDNTESWDKFELAKFYLDNFKNIKFNIGNRDGLTVLDCFTFLKKEIIKEHFESKFLFDNNVNDYNEKGQKFILEIYNKGARFNVNKDGDKLINALKKKYK